MTARDQDSAIGEEVCSGCVEATAYSGCPSSSTSALPPPHFRYLPSWDFEAERDLVLLAGGAAATASLARSADFDAARDRLPAGFASEPRSTSTGVGAVGGDIFGVACASGFRPNPSALAIVERRSV
jgi:hypothetical protein